LAGCDYIVKDETPAFAARLQKAAEQEGDANVQYNLGTMYMNGAGVPKDREQARKWLEKAADQNHADAQNALGLMYWKGRGVDKDREQARQWFEKAIAQGHREAYHHLQKLEEQK